MESSGGHKYLCLRHFLPDIGKAVEDVLIKEALAKAASVYGLKLVLRCIVNDFPELSHVHCL